MSYASLVAWRRAEPQQAVALALEEHVLCVKRIQWSCLCISVCVFLPGATSVGIYVHQGQYVASVYKKPVLDMLTYCALGDCQRLL